MLAGRTFPILVDVDKKGDQMNEMILTADLNRDRTSELRADGCRRCVRTRSRWLTSEYRRYRRTS